jgi:hypothetical protein
MEAPMLPVRHDLAPICGVAFALAAASMEKSRRQIAIMS